MKNCIASLTVLVIALGLVACDGSDPKDHDHDHGTSHEDHDHDHDHDGDDHEGHDHAEDGHEGHDHAADEHGGHGGHGKRHELGKADIGGFAVTVATLGEIEAGHEGVVDVEVSGGAPSMVRAWVGVESAQGSLKAKLEKEGDGYHGHVEVPATLPTGSAVWIEIEDADGKRAAASFKLD